MMNMWRGRQPLRMAAEEDQGIEDLWGYMGGMGPQRPAAPVATAAPAAPAATTLAQVQATMPAGATSIMDPSESAYFAPQERGESTNTLGDGQGLLWLNWDQVPGFEGIAEQMRNAQNSVSGAASGPLLLDALQAGGNKIFENREPDYWVTRGVLDPENKFVGDPQRFQLDDDQAFWNAAMLAAAVTGANVMSAQSALGADALSGMDLAADGGGNALWETGTEVATKTLPDALSGMDLAADGGGNALWETGTEVATKTLPNTLPEVMAAEPGIPASSIAPVTPPAPLPAMPSLNAAAPSLLDSLKSFGGSAKDWIKQNPNLARGLFTAAGGLAGGLAGGGSGPTGGATPAPQTFGPPQAWTSGLTMGGGGPGPRQRAPVIDYELPRAGGLSMGAGRFLGRGG
jgi:hypothetical protein